MSTAVRILILVGELLFSVLNMFYLLKWSKTSKKMRLEDKTMILGIFITGLFASLALFCFTFPTFRFLSYYKIELVTTVFGIFMLLINTAYVSQYVETKYKNGLFIALIVLYIALFFTIFFYPIEENLIVDKQEEYTYTLNPTLDSKETGVAVQKDSDGHIITYSYFYYDDNGKLHKYDQIEENSSKTEIIHLKDGSDSYVVVTVTTTTTINKEKKPSAEDYKTVTSKENYQIFLNEEQVIEYY